jgi:glycosyltransferase involved in cell wall biosynthesis
VTRDVPSQAPTVALVSVGIGRVQRGFERYFGDLFGVLGGNLPMTLFKSAGAVGEREIVPPMLKWATALARRAPLGRLAGRAEYNRDCLAFAIMMLPRLMRGRFDIVHCIDPPLALALRHLKRASGLRSRILFTDGCVMPPEYYPRVDHIHHVAHAAHQNGLASGVPGASMTMVPCGMHAVRFPLADDRATLRRRYGIGQNTFVVLAVSAIKREHKRVDHIVAEFSRLEGDVLLWLDGNPEDETLLRAARARLGSRLRVSHVPSAEVPALYRAANVMVHAALEESFGLSIVEAACSGVPVLTHHAAHFEWLLGGKDLLIDMQREGVLSDRLREIAGRVDHESALARARARALRGRFDWQALVPQYLGMYRRVAALSDRPAARSDRHT